MESKHKKSPVVNDDNECCLSGTKPFFHVVLTKSNLCPRYSMRIPSGFNLELPDTSVPVILGCNGKKWSIGYHGGGTRPRFDSQWKNFVVDNDLMIGDACVFQLLECSRAIMKFKVVILRSELPQDLLDVIGGNSTNPILID